MFCHPADFSMVGSQIFFYSVAWWLPMGAGLGLNVWLYLGKPFLRENAAGIMGVLQRAESWAAIGLFVTTVLFTASALLVAMSYNVKPGQLRRRTVSRFDSLDPHVKHLPFRQLGRAPASSWQASRLCHSPICRPNYIPRSCLWQLDQCRHRTCEGTDRVIVAIRPERWRSAHRRTKYEAKAAGGPDHCPA
jgi:hypothetical protein